MGTLSETVSPTAGPWRMPHEPTCPVVDAVRMLSGKWKPMMLHMLVAEPLHFEEIVRRLAPVNRKVISEQLHQLVADDLVVRRSYDDGRQRSLYTLSASGQQLAPILEQLLGWSRAHRPLP